MVSIVKDVTRDLGSTILFPSPHYTLKGTFIYSLIKSILRGTFEHGSCPIVCIASKGLPLMNGSKRFEREDQDVTLGEFDDLRKLREVVDREGFRPLLQEIFGCSGSGEATVRGRAILGHASHVPDQKTTWKYRHRLAESGRTKKAFEAQLREARYALTGGQIAGSTMVEVPRQRNIREEHAMLEQGKVPEAWKEPPGKLAQKDVDATWTKQHGCTTMAIKIM